VRTIARQSGIGNDAIVAEICSLDNIHTTVWGNCCYISFKFENVRNFADSRRRTNTTCLFATNRKETAYDHYEHATAARGVNKAENVRNSKKASTVILLWNAQEIDRYDSQPKNDPTDDPYEAWRTLKSEFPMLGKLARALLCIPATSLPSERLFSKASMFRLIIIVSVSF
jgi:hypothetical protein